MNSKMVNGARALATLISLAINASAFAQSTTIEIDNFPRSMTTQRASQWCWAASLESVLRSYGVNRSQEEIVAATYGGLVNAPAQSPLQLYRVLNNLSFPDGDTLEIVRGDFGIGAPPPALLASELSEDHPVIAWYLNPGGGGGHAVVIFGVRVQDTAYGRVVTAIKYHDPWPGSGVRVVPAAQLAARMTNYFVVRAAHISRNRENNTGRRTNRESVGEGVVREDPEKCRRECDRAGERCDRQAERAVRECVQDKKSYEWRVCGCPNWRPGDFQCYDICRSIFEDMQSCDDLSESDCSDEHDSCTTRCD